MFTLPKFTLLVGLTAKSISARALTAGGQPLSLPLKSTALTVT
jgi:hypothetical protein